MRRSTPAIAAYATAKAAFDLGVRVVEGVRVTGFRLEDGRVTGVETDHGPVECDVAVIAAGLWSRDLGLLAGTRLPLHAAEHYWAQTEPVEGASRDLPIIRDLDGYFYIRHYRGGLLVGAFEPDGRPRTTASIPDDFSFGEFEPDLPHFELPLSKARRRVPALAKARFAHFLDAPESFTPDANFLLGETAEVAGLFVAAGMNSQGIIFGPGVGRALAEWIDEGAPTIDASDLDVRRFSPAQANAGYLFERTRESLGRLYAMHWPFLQPGTARGLRRVPLYDRLSAAGACFGETAGWERANWYGPAGSRPEYEYSYGRQNWFGAAAEEHRAAREGVALFDLSSFAKLRVEGPAALGAVQRVFTADLDREPGAVVYTSMLNGRGGTELDATVTRLADDLFLVVAPTAAQAKTFHWLRRYGDPAAVVTDVTSGLGTLAVTGPRSRELLALLTGADLSDAAFPFATAQEIDVGWATALALRISFAGELGWELYAPVESLATLYDQLLEAGAGLGLRHAGYHALDSLRAEKGYRHWGADMGPTDTPFEAGLGSTVAMDKPGGFIGREALVVLATDPPRRRLAHVLLAEPEPQLYHGESVVHDGRIVGRVTSGAFGHTLGAAVGLAAIEADAGRGGPHRRRRRRRDRDRRRAGAGAPQRPAVLRPRRRATAWATDSEADSLAAYDAVVEGAGGQSWKLRAALVCAAAALLAAVQRGNDDAGLDGDGSDARCRRVALALPERRRQRHADDHRAARRDPAQRVHSAGELPRRRHGRRHGDDRSPGDHALRRGAPSPGHRPSDRRRRRAHLEGPPAAAPRPLRARRPRRGRRRPRRGERDAGRAPRARATSATGAHGPRPARRLRLGGPARRGRRRGGRRQPRPSVRLPRAAAVHHRKRRQGDAPRGLSPPPPLRRTRDARDAHAHDHRLRQRGRGRRLPERRQAGPHAPRAHGAHAHVPRRQRPGS